MNRISVVILWVLALLALQPALAAEPRQQPTAREKARTVYIFHQPVVMLQATFGQTTPEERVLRTRSALRAFTEDDIRQPLRVVPVIRYGQPGRLFLMNGKPVLLLSQADLDEGDDLTLDQAAQRVLARMEAQRTSLQEQIDRNGFARSKILVLEALLRLRQLACHPSLVDPRWKVEVELDAFVED